MRSLNTTMSTGMKKSLTMAKLNKYRFSITIRVSSSHNKYLLNISSPNNNKLYQRRREKVTLPSLLNNPYNKLLINSHKLRGRQIKKNARILEVSWEVVNIRRGRRAAEIAQGDGDDV